ncbi:carbohydrate sulfotransferase 5-like [Lethenteron reissneri]|uniref:carbohydrate sulfotransferase 5-like n=1 Tax=Lethenteron reissneri TaxID=7753 RepID=UPI002AB64AED|nr:carbohydrate sulfotransferase 5-like [Lethenteron reissneri]
MLYQTPGLARTIPWRLLGACSTPTQPPQQPQQQQRTNTLILSSWRSGSSFLGQVFNQHPEVFYLMEPLKHVWTAVPTSGERALRGATRDLLRSLCACDETVLEFYIAPPRRLGSLFLFHHSAALCRLPACSAATAANASGAHGCQQRCSAAPFAGIGRACERSRHAVVKSVRLFDARALRPLVADPGVRLRIIHLVRDPRAVLASRRKLSRVSLEEDDRAVLGRADAGRPSRDVDVMEAICRSNDDVAAAAEGDRREGRTPGVNGGLSDAYMAVRYEDLVSEPARTTREMFRFAGIELPDAVAAWVEVMTHGQRDGAGEFDVVSLQSPAVARKWRRSLPFEEARAVQSACRAAMRRFRYREFASAGELRNASIDAFYR